MKVFRQKSLEKHPYLQPMVNHLIITTDFFRWAKFMVVSGFNFNAQAHRRRGKKAVVKLFFTHHSYNKALL